MSNVVKLFQESDVQMYYVVDPGLTPFWIDSIISEIDIKNEATWLEISTNELKNEMLLKNCSKNNNAKLENCE